MFKGLFRPDSGLMIVMTQITDCIFLSLFFLIGCVPVVTIGASAAALYDAVYRGFRKGERNTWQRFLSTYLRNLKSGLAPTVVYLVAFCALGWGVIQCWNGAVYQQVSWALFAGVALIGVVMMGVLSLLFPMLSRFDNTLGDLLRNTVVLALANIPRTMAVGMIQTATLLVCVRFVIPGCILPALAALLSSLLIEPIFKPYMPEESEEEAAQ